MRFPGFEGEWKDEKIGGVFSILNGYAFSSTDSVNTGVPWVKIADVGIQKMKRDNVSFLPETFRKQYSKFILKKGDYVIALTRPILNGKLKIAQIDDFFDGGLLNQRVGKIITSNSPGFIYCCLQKSDLIKSIENSIAGSDPPNLSPNEINSLTMTLPGLSEQKKIVAFLSLIDQRIHTQNKIIEDLGILKRTISNRIFEQKLRFKNDGSHEYPAWKIKNLEEVCEIVGGGTPETSKSDYWNGDIQWFTPTEIKTNYVEKSTRTITDLGLKNSSAKLLPKGTILLTTRATVGEVAIALVECSTNQGFQSLVVKDGVNNVFIFNWLKEHKHELVKRANGSTFPEVSKSEIEKIPISIPSFSEQIKIASCISSIDDKVEIERILLRKWQQQKKILLKKMFI